MRIHGKAAHGAAAITTIILALSLTGTNALAAGLPPTVDDQLPVAASITRTGAFLSGTVDPEGSATTYQFEYGPTASYGWSTPLASVGAESADVAVGPQPLGELEPGTTYHFRLVATNAAGTTAGSDLTFTTAAPTPPTVQTTGTSEIAPNGVTVSGLLEAHGLQVTYGFQLALGSEPYGPPAGLTGVGAGVAQLAVSLHLTGLSPGSTYRYRLLATSVDGTTYGADATFTTSAFPNVFATPSAPLPAVQTPAIAFPKQSTGASAHVKHKTRAKARAKHKAKVKRKPKRHSTRGR